RLREKGITVDIDLNEGLFRFPEHVLFASGEYNLNANGIRAITDLGTIMSKRLPCYSGPRGAGPPAACDRPELHKPGKFDVILIEGHTDAMRVLPGHRLDDNLQLSVFRSWETYNTLVKSWSDNGSDITGLKNADGQYLIGVSGYGENRAIPDKENKMNMAEVMARNRRIDFRIVLAAPEPSAGLIVRQEAQAPR
ncbi:MAG: hypothetical protein LBW85_11965, partial [Deltaproteobacteria bacterium]|nr:hypothetical protein [Deltaproteobacteria bacterium]